MLAPLLATAALAARRDPTGAGSLQPVDLHHSKNHQKSWKDAHGSGPPSEARVQWFSPEPPKGTEQLRHWFSYPTGTEQKREQKGLSVAVIIAGQARSMTEPAVYKSQLTQLLAPLREEAAVLDTFVLLDKDDNSTALLTLLRDHYRVRAVSFTHEPNTMRQYHRLGQALGLMQQAREGT